MKVWLAMTLGLTVGVLLTAAAEMHGVSYFGHGDVAAKLAKGGSFLATPTYSVSASHRDKAGQVEVHDKETDVFYVVDGSATFLTGGTIVGGKVSSPNQHLGTDMQGGDTHELSKGDVMVVPAGTAHWFKSVPDHVNYFVVKVIKP
jgi:mannose-6-phosphate isomerase-like protein (cupin superfamily)